MDQAGEATKGSSGGPEELGSSPRLLGIEHRPVSVGSFGPPSTQTVPGLAAGTLSEEQVRDKFYAYWTRQKVRGLIVLLTSLLTAPIFPNSATTREMDVFYTSRSLEQFCFAGRSLDK